MKLKSLLKNEDNCGKFNKADASAGQNSISFKFANSKPDSHLNP